MYTVCLYATHAKNYYCYNIKVEREGLGARLYTVGLKRECDEQETIRFKNYWGKIA